MILSNAELNVVKPTLAMIEHLQHVNVVLNVINPNGRQVTIDISAAGILIKAVYSDSSPAVEFYKYPQGLAQAYGVSIKRILNQTEGD